MATPKISEAGKQFLASLRAQNYSNSTVGGYETVLNRMATDLRNIQVGSITASHIDKWFYGPGGLREPHINRCINGPKMTPPIQPSTFNQYRNRTKQFLKWCKQKGWVKGDPMEYSRPMKINAKRERQRPEPLTLLRLLEVTSEPRDRAYLAMAMNTALRANEINRMVVGDLDLDAGDLQTLITKTETTDVMPVTEDLDREMRRWLTHYTVTLGRPLRDEDVLFPKRNGGQISHFEWSEEAGRKVIVRVPVQYRPDVHIDRAHSIVQGALGRLGLPTKGEGVHTIRRAVARAYFDHVAAEGGYVEALRETAALLHHESMATTEGYLGTSVEKARRDKRLKGRPLLTAIVNANTENVITLKPRDVS